MSDLFKVSGKRVAFPEKDGAWTFQTRPGGWVIAERKTAQGVERKKIAVNESKGNLSFSLNGFLYHGKIETQSKGSVSSASEADLSAQFPGKVRKLLVQVGDAVDEGTPLILIEAMKMEFSIKAPYAGKVKNILVTENQQLTPGQKLVELSK
jgi:3-methylcrotonyl-CoA carboxylase alpha subunit